ncbi:hypothetical protein ZEAMMB73_Zm00001d045062 [Zea mays]|uniref:Ubiquitin-like protease family profile domain-containing protein n=1 Tax=Zea mays TaxID=4577 RepID=A0A1D6NTA0_MAIZE|nr:hypothetical protein ZEAMMB73_Zm00001d045062 [Zea mays]
MECLFQPNTYLGDEVFIPINIRETHWYLVVIHARNMEIQVLDSLGTSQDRKDLTDSIKGLQRQIDMISQRKELKNHSYSCGLFLLNYIEYWTEDELSDNFTQKRKLLHVLDDSEVVYEDDEGSITQADLQRWFIDDWDKRAPVKVSIDGCTNDFLMVSLSTKDMPVTKADSIDVLCDCIMAIEDDTTLE